MMYGVCIPRVLFGLYDEDERENAPPPKRRIVPPSDSPMFTKRIENEKLGKEMEAWWKASARKGNLLPLYRTPNGHTCRDVLRENTMWRRSQAAKLDLLATTILDGLLAFTWTNGEFWTRRIEQCEAFLEKFDSGPATTTTTIRVVAACIRRLAREELARMRSLAMQVEKITRIFVQDHWRHYATPETWGILRSLTDWEPDEWAVHRTIIEQAMASSPPATGGGDEDDRKVHASWREGLTAAFRRLEASFPHAHAVALRERLAEQEELLTGYTIAETHTIYRLLRIGSIRCHLMQILHL
jgi:hypothetical protein